MEETEKYGLASYRRSRIANIAQAAFEYLISLMVADAFLSKLLINIGISDSVIGVISSVVSLGCLFQLLSIFLQRYIRHTKRAVLIFNTTCQVLFMCVYFVPFLPFGTLTKTVVVVVMYLLACASKRLVEPIYFQWQNSYIHPRQRAYFAGWKEMVSLLMGMLFSLAVGVIIDRFDGSGNIHKGFLFVAFTMLALNVLNFISILLIQEDTTETAADSNSFGEVFRHTLCNKKFRQIVVLTSLGDIAQYMTIGFMGVYEINNLMLPLSVIQIINIAACCLRMAFSVPMGRYSDKRGYARGIELGFMLAAAAFFLNIFCTKNTWWFVIIFMVLYQVSMAGTVQNASNILFSCVPMDYIAPAVAVRGSVSGICGFLSSLVGSAILSHIQNSGNSIFGIAVCGQQALSAISFFILCSAVCYARLVFSGRAVTKASQQDA